MDNPYTYIIGFELRVRDFSKIAYDYLHLRRNSPSSSVSGQSMQPDRDSFHTADEDIARRQPQIGNGQPTPTASEMHNTPHPPAQLGYSQPHYATPLIDFTPHLPPPHG